MFSDTDFRTAVRRTLAYAEVFQASLTQLEIWQFLHWGEKVSVAQLALVSEFRAAPVGKTDSNVRLGKWRAVHTAVRIFARVPWIRGVWVTGALAAGTAKDDDDLDFLFLTDRNRMWLARAVVVAVGLLLGRYRSRWRPQSYRDLWCCNIWLEPGALALPPERRSLYEARELVQAVPVYVRSGERASVLLEKNRWAEKFVANGFQFALERGKKLLPPLGTLPLPLFSPVEYLLNALLRSVQHVIMARRMTRETISAGSAFFHPRDTRSWVQKRYETICSVQKIDPCFNEPAP